MSHSRQTEHYNLPLYNGTDIINPLTDFNDANEAIDEALYNSNERSAHAENVAESVAQTVGGYDARIEAVETEVAGYSSAIEGAVEKSNDAEDMIAPKFSATKVGGYNKGDYVVYNDKLYKFTANHLGAWTGLDVTVETVTANLGSVVEETSRRIIIMGDSYNFSYDGDTEQYVTSVGDRIKNLFPEHASEVIANWVVGGAGFVNKSGEYTFIEFLNATYSTISDRDTVTDLLLFGGYNELGATAEATTNAGVAFCQRVKELFPNCKVHLAFVGWGVRAYGTEMRHLAVNSMPAYKSISELSPNCVYVDKSELILHDYALCGTDGVHPNNLGYDVLARKLGSYLMEGNEVDITYMNVHTVFTPVSGVTATPATANFYTNRRDEVTQVYCQDILHFEGSLRIDSGRYMIGNVPKNGLIFGYIIKNQLPTQPSLTFPVNIAVVRNDDSVVQEVGQIEIYGGYVDLLIPGFESETVKTINVLPFSGVALSVLC